MVDEKTLRPCELEGAKTIQPASVCCASEAVPSSMPDRIGRWSIRKLLASREYCQIYLAEHDTHKQGVIKLYHSQAHPSPCMQKLEPISRSCKHLLSVIEHGTHEGYAYDITPYMPEGSLEGQILDDKIVMQVVVPQLASALHILHQNELLHNDIKPSNIYWDSRNTTIVLGDFDTVTFADQNTCEDISGTREYMAPEKLTGGQAAASQAADYCSMGLTLLALLQGESPLRGKTDMQLRRIWMRGIPVPDSISPQLKILINGLIVYDPAQRFHSDGISRWMRTYNVQPHEAAAQPSADADEELPKDKPLWFGSEPVIDIPGMVEKAGQCWELACFLLVQKRISIFLRQFDLSYYRLCCQCEKYFDANEGLFALLHSLSRSEDFYWYGEHYMNLEDFATRILDAGTNEAIQNGAHFIRSNMLGLYLSNLNAAKDKLDLAQQLSRTALQHPELAITELLATMSPIPELKWKGHIFRNLEDLSGWLLSDETVLDEVIQELYMSKKFEAWLKFIHEGSFLYEIQDAMKGVAP